MTMIAFRKRVAMPLVVASLACAAAAGAAYLLGRGQAHARARVAAGKDLAKVRHEVHLGLEQACLMERNTRALFNSSEEVTAAEFLTYVREVLASRPTLIQAIGWAPRVAATDLEQHERSVRSGQYSAWIPRPRPELPSDAATGPSLPLRDYRVHGAGGQEPEPGAPLTPVVWVEPSAGNEPVLGLDLHADATLRAALQRTEVTGRTALTAPIQQLGEDGGDCLGALLLLAVRRVPCGRPDWVDSELLGSVVIAFRYVDVVTGALARCPDVPLQDLRVQLFDADGQGGRQLLHDCGIGAPGTAAPAAEGEMLVEELTVGGRRLELVAWLSPRFLAANEGSEPLLLALAALLLSGLVGICYGCNLRRVEHRATRAHSAFLHSVLTSLSEGVVVADREGRVLFTNRVARRLLGPIDSTPPLDWPQVCGLFLDDARTRCPVEQLPLVRAIHGQQVGLEHVYVQNESNPDGTWISISGSPMLDDEHQLQGGISVIRDITDQKRSEGQILRLSAVVEQTADLVFITNRDGRIVYANPSFERHTGWRAAEVLGKAPSILRADPTAAPDCASVLATLQGGQTFRGTILHRRRDGTQFHGEHTITPIRDASDGNVYFVSVCKDITDRLRSLERETEMQIAATVQERLYPARPPGCRGLDVAGACFPANATCGDYYDFVELADGALGLVVGDIAGHGLGPALIMAETRAYLRSLLWSGHSACAALRRLGEWLVPDLEDGSFVTMLAVVVDPAARQLTFVNAGHWPGFVLDAEGGVKLEMAPGGVALGLGAESPYECSQPCRLETGDTIVLLTDGILEARSPDGTLFGRERALRVVRQHRHEPAATIIRRLREALDLFVDRTQREDDQTLVICRAVDVAVTPEPQATDTGWNGFECASQVDEQMLLSTANGHMVVDFRSPITAELERLLAELDEDAA